MNIAALETAIQGKSIAELSESDRAALSALLIPSGTFTAEQKELLKNWWLIVPSERLQELESLNLPGLQASPIETLAGQKVLSADLLTDYGDGRPWAHLREFLRSLTLTKLTAEDFPQPEPRVSP